MKKLNTHLIKGISILLLMVTVVHLEAAQRRFAPMAPSAISDYNYTIANDAQVSNSILEFDLFLLDTDPAQAFEMAEIQAGITLDPAIYNGGTITATLVAGSSQLSVVSQQPASITFTQAQNCIKIAARTPPGFGNGSIISTTSPGTKICRVRLTNSVPFAANTKASLTFCFTTVPYPTKVFQYVSTINTQLTSDATNCFSLASNITLNAPPTAFAVTGGGSYCQGTGGLAVGLAGSQVGVTYTLYNGTTALTPTVAGTGSAITFGNQLAGTYTVQGTSFGGTLVMTGNAVLIENPTLTAGVSIAPDLNTVCAGTTVTFTATPTNGGTAPVYQWYKGATAVGTNSATYAYIPANGDVITVQLTSNATPCLIGSPVTSNAVTMIVNPSVIAAVSIAADQNTVCPGTMVTFTATPTNGGTAPVYQWYKGATAVGTNSATYAYIPANGDVITVQLTSNATPCLIGSPVTSNAVTMIVNPALTAAVSIVSDLNTVCAGTTVTFTATPTNGGTAPVYQWYNGATTVGTNSPTYAYAPANGDVITVRLTSNATPCLIGSPVTSNAVTMIVNPALTAGVSIVSDLNTVCAGTTVTFTATPTNGGTTPVYQWYNGATAVGTNSATYAYTPANGDVITVQLTSNATPCLIGSPVTSNAVTMIVNPALTAGVSIAPDQNTVCPGTTVTFTATPTNGGTAPVYQWYNGATAVGTNSATYAYTPANGDVIKVVMTSNATPCLIGSPVTSNAVTIIVNTSVTAGVSISVNLNPVNAGTQVTFTAVPVGGGTSPTYQWYNGATPVGTNSNTFIYTPTNGDIISVLMTSNAVCVTGSPATSNSVTMTVSIGTSIDQNNVSVYIYSMNKNIFVNCSQLAKQVLIYNTLGSVVRSENNVSGTKEFYMNTLPNEYYFVKVITDNNVYTQKVLLK
jgi:hypothetical protein